MSRIEFLLLVPVRKFGTSLRRNGRVSLGDVGLAIRVATGAASGFLFGDAGGGGSDSVGEYSVNLVRALFGGSPTSEAVSFLVFPGIRGGPVALPLRIPGLLRDALVDLAQFANAEDIVTRLALPQLGEEFHLRTTFVPRTGFRRPLKKVLAHGTAGEGG
ncbi:MAG: hypothetical protein ACREDT_02895 [Methylocella sp.]